MIKKIIVFALLPAAVGKSIAQVGPVVGLLEQIPVRDANRKIRARPLYILTDKKLGGPSVFSALQRMGEDINVACCFEVVDAAPLDRKMEFERYRYDPNFSAHLDGIKGYQFLYRARPVAKNRWTPAMASTMDDLGDASDVHPYSLAVIQATFTRPTLPASFLYAGQKVSYAYRYPANAARVIHSFTFSGHKVEFSEPAVVVDGE